jgi:hypothetical protein
MKDMDEAEFSKVFNSRVKVDKDHAQILLEVSSTKTYDDAIRIIEQAEVNIVESKHLSPYWILLKLDVADTRTVILKLIENGFSKVKGINAEFS